MWILKKKTLKKKKYHILNDVFREYNVSKTKSIFLLLNLLLSYFPILVNGAIIHLAAQAKSFEVILDSHNSKFCWLYLQNSTSSHFQPSL